MNVNLIASPRLFALSISMFVVLSMLTGCAGRVSLIPNSDKSLRRTPAQFAAESAKRTYRLDAPEGGAAEARAFVAYDNNFIQVLNLSDEDWSDIEVWVNHRYVVHVPRIEAGKQRVTTLNFMMLYDDQGNPFPSDNRKQFIDKLEIVKDGTKYDVPLALAD